MLSSRRSEGYAAAHSVASTATSAKSPASFGDVTTTGRPSEQWRRERQIRLEAQRRRRLRERREQQREASEAEKRREALEAHRQEKKRNADFLRKLRQEQLKQQPKPPQHPQVHHSSIQQQPQPQPQQTASNLHHAYHQAPPEPGDEPHVRRQLQPQSEPPPELQHTASSAAVHRAAAFRVCWEASSAPAKDTLAPRAPPEGRNKIDAIPTYESKVDAIPTYESQAAMPSESLEDARAIMKMLRQQPRLRAQQEHIGDGCGEDSRPDKDGVLCTAMASEAAAGASFPVLADGVGSEVGQEPPVEETNLAPDHRAEKAPPRPLHQHGNAWTDHLQQRPSQLFDSLDLSSSRGQSGCFDSSKPGDQRQGVMSARARLGGNEVGTKGDGRPERMPEMDHRPSQALDISDAQMPAEGIPPAESAQPSAQVQSEFLRGDSVTVPPPSTDAQSSTSATYVSLKKKVKEGSTQSSFRGHAAVGRPVVHAARWGKGSETESELQKRELREKAKAFATQCREQTRLVSAG